MTRLVIANVALPEGLRDVEVVDGVITGIGDRLTTTGSDAVDGRGGALIPGLHDHHLHLHALAAAWESVRCGPPDVRNSDELAEALESAPGAGDADWVRGVDYVETVAGLLDRETLDQLHTRRPVRLQHRSGAVWFLNSAAAAAVDLANGDHPGVERDASGEPTGRVWRADTWLRERLGATRPPALATVGTELARFGVTAVTDATPDLPAGSLAHLLAEHTSGALPQRLHLLGAGTDTEGLPSTITLGPRKIVLADSDLPDFPTLCRWVRDTRDRGGGVAVHSVTRESLLLLLAAFDEVGTHPDDRIEHGAIIAAETATELCRRGIPVVTQPGFIADRGDDYLDRLDPHDAADLYRCRTLLDAGVRVALSSDAPYGPTDPWSVIAAAAARTAPDGRIVGGGERIDRHTALRLYLAPLPTPGADPRTVAVGAPADLVVLDCSVDEALTIGSDAVRCTIIRGRVVHHR
ncbi:amidohydrolase family protein [Gordonia terrae]|uniref:amidohydrolase family protein n=1 Tax=Gordonia terrae TaxID=2055 RepID=UPI00200AAF98|nr:amidohydrolase family protein [Gordonia terrae]UPW08626.1 amidohydrolase family protein [Gordonia terrae]